MMHAAKPALYKKNVYKSKQASNNFERQQVFRWPFAMLSLSNQTKTSKVQSKAPPSLRWEGIHNSVNSHKPARKP